MLEVRVVASDPNPSGEKNHARETRLKGRGSGAVCPGAPHFDTLEPDDSFLGVCVPDGGEGREFRCVARALLEKSRRKPLLASFVPRRRLV